MPLQIFCPMHHNTPLTQAWNVLTHTQDGVACWAHIGGLIAGAALLPLLRHPDVVLFECVREADM